MFHKCFGDGRVYGIHRHVVTIVGSPSQCQFGEVASAHHKSSGLVGYIHEYLRPFACLTVFICHIVNHGVVCNVTEMDVHSFGDVYFAHGDSERAH